MTNDRIERLAVNAVNSLLLKSKILIPHLNVGDKVVSFDGSIQLLAKESNKKSDFRGFLPVQIKGQESKDLLNNEISYGVHIEDLRNYSIANGIIYFVVRLNEDGSQVYYKELTPSVLNDILFNAGKCKSKYLKFKKIPDNIKEIEQLIFDCYNKCHEGRTNKSNKSQDNNPSVFQPLSEKALKRKKFSRNKTDNSISKTVDYSSAAINKSKGKESHKGYYKDGKKKIIYENVTVSIGKEKFYDNIKIIKNRDCLEFKFGNSFRFTSAKKCYGTLIHKNSSHLRQYVYDTSFFIKAREQGGFTLDGASIALEKCKSDLDLKRDKENLKKYKRIVQLLDVLNCQSDIDINKLSNEDWDNINLLLFSIVDGKSIIIKSNPDDFFITKIGDLNFIFIAVKDDKNNGQYFIRDFFKEFSCFIFNDNGKPIYIPKFLFLTADDLCKFDNVQCDYFEEWLNKSDCTPSLIFKTNLFLQELIKAYDLDNSRCQFIETALSISKWLLKKTNNNLTFYLNNLQIKKRLDDLTLEDKVELHKIVETPSISSAIKTASYLLLDDQVGANLHFNEMNKETQENFRQYPICHFFNDNT